MALSPVTKNPIAWCAARWKAAQRTGDPCADLLQLATVADDGGAAVRVVLLKHLSPRGVGFVTNAFGPKVAQWKQQPLVEACCYWPSSGVQVRLRGKIAPMSGYELDALWRARTRDAQLVYHMDLPQSSPIAGPAFLTQRLARTTAEWKTVAQLPRAPSYTGYLLVPTQIELFLHSPIRLNQRIRYKKIAAGWKSQWLAP